MKLTLLRRAKEGGQAIVLIALLMVILIASVGLAIDGGGMFLLYRDIQNATDSAGLSAAYALCTEGDPIVQAMRTAELNGFDNDDPNTTVTITRTTDAATSEELIVVDITAEKPSYFIQVIYPGPLIVSSQTTAFCRRTAGASSDIVNRYALRSLAQPGECTASPGWDIRGTRFTIDGDVWLPNIKGNVEFSSNQPNPELRDDPADILGDIYVGEDSTSNYNSGHTGLNINEELPSSAVFGPSDGWVEEGGDNVIDYNQPWPGDLPYDMDYFRPGGALDLARTDYHDLTPACSSGNKVEFQDFGQNGYGGFFDDATNTWQPGIYYSPCELTLNHDGPDMTGNGVTFIGEGFIDFSTPPYNMTAPAGLPLVVSNRQSSPNPNHCSEGQHAIRFNADSSYMQGPIIAFRGFPAFQGNHYTFDSCISARGFQHNGNDGSIYRCQPSTGPDQADFGLRE